MLHTIASHVLRYISQPDQIDSQLADDLTGRTLYIPAAALQASLAQSLVDHCHVVHQLSPLILAHAQSLGARQQLAVLHGSSRMHQLQMVELQQGVHAGS